MAVNMFGVCPCPVRNRRLWLVGPRRTLQDKNHLCWAVLLGAEPIAHWRRMMLLIILIVLLLLGGGSGFYLGGPQWGGSIGGIILLVLIVLLLTGRL